MPPTPMPLESGLAYARRRSLFLVAMGAPALVYVLVVGVGPLLQGAWYSLFDYNLAHPARRHFVGLANYAALLADPSVRAALVNTTLFTAGAVALEFALGLGIALLLWRDSAFNRLCLALLLVPVTVTPVVVGLIFKALLGPDYGFIGYPLARWGWSSPRGLLGDPHTALAALVAVDVWEWTPLVALILLAGLKALPGDILEAARADGATAVQRFRLVILPLLLPAVFLALVLRIMDAFRIFDTIYVTTAGGPADATQTLMVLAVKQGLEFFNIGAASAIGNLMLACIALLAGGFALLIRRAGRRGERPMSRRWRIALQSVALGLVVVLFLLPVVWLVTTAYKPVAAAFTSPPTLLFAPTLANFRTVLALFDIVGLLRSSFAIAGGSAVLSLLLGIPAGYALARARSRAAIGIAYVFLAIRMVPAVAALIPFYLVMRDVGLLGSWAAVILINAVLNSAFVTWMMFSYFRALPPELPEAALTDGCTPFGAFWRVELPLVRAGIIASALFCILFSWNDFLYASFLTRLDTKPISVALLAAYGTYDISWGTLGALAHFSTVPIVLLVLALNRYFVQGLVKGVH